MEYIVWLFYIIVILAMFGLPIWIIYGFIMTLYNMIRSGQAKDLLKKDIPIPPKASLGVNIIGRTIGRLIMMR